MGFIKGDDIMGFSFEGGEVVCCDCADDEDTADLTEKEILTDKDTEKGDLYFCDRCKKKL